MRIFKKLKKLKQFEKSLKIANEMLDIQGCNGNYNVDNYMLGLYNGMEYIISLLEQREYDGVDGHYINFKKHEQISAKELIAKYERDEK
jgi:hypothetical protein